MASIREILASLTLEEKAGQLNHLQGTYSTDPYGQKIDLEGQIREGRVGAVTTASGLAQLREWQRLAVEESRSGIPLLFAHDVIHGYRTIFPIPLGQAASWNLGLIEEAERTSAVEASAAGLNWTFAPMVDIARDARWGRAMEGPGEDPCLAAAIARARVKGLQGDDLRAKDSVISCLKHYAAYGAAEAGREYNTTDMSESRLREVYLPSFQAGIEAGARTVMNSFNSLNGVPASCNEMLLKQILKGEWGFTGITVSDAFSLFEIILHGVAKDEREAALKCFLAGSDTDLWPGTYSRELPGLVRDGLISEEALDEAVLRVLKLKEEVGLLDDPYGRMDQETFDRVVFCPAHREKARELAVQSLVLVKNESAFPLPAGIKSLAVIGGIACSRRAPDLMGNWAAEGRIEDVVTILDAIKEALPDVEVSFTPAYEGHGESTDDQIAEAAAAASAAEAALLVIGERGDQTGESAAQSEIRLSGRQAELAKTVAAAQPNLVTVLACGRALALEGDVDPLPNLLVIWQPGTEAGHAVADVVLGRRDAVGRLPVSFPRRVGQLPMTYASLPTGRPRLGPEDDRWGISRYSDVVNEPLFPFGFGLSLNRVDLGEAVVTALPDGAEVRLTAANRGGAPAVEVVQLYIRDTNASMSRPVRELKAFERVELAPGESREIVFVLARKDLSFWIPGRGWTAEPGEFEVYVGRDSVCPLAGSFILEG